ncbi:MAG: 2Fe-2S iron-sulfur cluster-binding protein [Smithellaceae bacterium]|jgi:NADH dehydrogenase/NADH:ubiquinone oxidoreductase subunit G
MMVNLIINGKKITAQEDTMILEAARAAGIDIPTLCAHESVSRSGACRLCVVEMRKGNRSKIVTSCLYPVEEGIVVETKNERVLNVRRLVLELLLARNPESDVIADLAKKLSVTPQPRFTMDTDKGKCILCRSCVRVCEEVVGVSAIGLSRRGSQKTVGPPYNEESAVCIGCGACAFICPTGHIEMETTEDKRIIWGRTFKMKTCDVCGRYFAPEDQLKYISKITGVPLKELAVCMDCH